VRKPDGFESLDVTTEELARGPYPPAGFLPVWDAELGNGDHFGLYWALGKEHIEPIVCDMCHDEWGLRPAFSSVGKFLEWLRANDGERGDVEVEDSGFSLNQFTLAKASIERGRPEEAIEHLRQACAAVDAYDYWFALAGQLRRVGDQRGSIEAALSAYRSGWYFGRASEGVLRMLRAARNNPAFSDDPIVKRSADLTARWGGEKENRNYVLLKECVEEYCGSSRGVHGLQVYENYAFMMMAAETTTFHERYGFRLKEWQDEFATLCARHLDDGRVAVA
jgi:hypothetical protein